MKQTKVREVRINSGVTQKELAVALGFDESYISRLEKGERTLKAERAKRLIETIERVKSWKAAVSAAISTVPSLPDFCSDLRPPRVTRSAIRKLL